MMARLRAALNHPVEFWSALGEIAFSKAIFWLGDTLDGNPSYRVATSLWDTAYWDLAAFLIGMAQLGAVLWGCRWARIVTAGLAGWFWLLLGLAFWMASTRAPGWVPLIGLGLLNQDAMLRIVLTKRGTQT